jgi:hypothetical protein
MESMRGRETPLNSKDTYCVFVDNPFSDGIPSNLLASANQAASCSPPRDRPFETCEPVRIWGVANIVCDTDGFQGPSDEIY